MRCRQNLAGGILLIAFMNAVAAGQETGFSLPSSTVFRAALRQQIREQFEMQTLGGRQFWGDVQFHQGWRIQRNVFTGHYRLLDEKDWRHASGSLEHCRERLSALCQERQIPPMSGKGVIVLHGIIRSSRSIYKVADELRKDGFLVFPVEYPSTQLSIPEIADSLQSIIEHLEGVEEIHLVGHSMGGLVIRAWFARYSDPRVRRVVMMGTPNYGAEMADLLQRNILFRTILGPAGQQLVTRPTGLISTLPVPSCEFAVIAGGLGNGKGWNPLIPGDDDGTVAVQSAQLVGAADSTVVPLLHHALLGSSLVSQQVSAFLRTGMLIPGRDPVPVKTPTAMTEAVSSVEKGTTSATP